MRRNLQSVVVFIVGSLAATLSAASCAQSEALVAREGPEDAAAPNGDLVEVDAGGDADSSVSAPQLLCIGTECPAPYATCETGSPYKCGTDLDNDNNNCGYCGHLCPSIPQLNISSATCSHGKCIPFCNEGTRDCNQQIEDGCETYVQSNNDNCGKCGNKCADGVNCINGVCGCPPGQTECHGQCVDTSKDDNNCRVCDNRCETPEDAGAPPPNMEYGCSESECGKLRCYQDNNHQWEDCDHAIKDNGCEIDLKQPSNANCGGCGIVCGPDETCTKFADGKIACACPNGKQRCESPYAGGSPSCKDFSNDVENCGGCGVTCPFSGLGSKPHQGALCTDGVCELQCDPGWGDCNANTADGCETNLLVHGGNCGACGNACNAAAGQPCVNGSCLMIECGSGETK